MFFSYVLIGLGSWLILDGIYSIYKYRNQTIQEHLIRVVRAGIYCD